MHAEKRHNTVDIREPKGRLRVSRHPGFRERKKERQKERKRENTRESKRGRALPPDRPHTFSLKRACSVRFINFNARRARSVHFCATYEYTTVPSLARIS